MSSIEQLIYKHALANAFPYGGKANDGAVLGKILADRPELKVEIENLRRDISKVVSEVNKLSPKEQEKKLKEIWPEFFAREKKEEKKELPELPNAIPGKAVFRLAPEPNGYIHIGHAISFFFNYYYAKKYKGKLILRFEDTNPESEELAYYKAIKEDIAWLGVKYDSVKNNSDDMKLFYDAAEKLIGKGVAYVCTCDVEEMRKNRFEGKECMHRQNSAEENKSLWKKMHKGLKAGAAVLRLKGDMKAGNSVMRDPTLFRIVEVPHPVQKKKYRVWPLYDFANAVEDAVCSVTHVLRSAEFIQRDELQNKIRILLGYKNPVILSYSRINFAGSPTSKRKILELMDKKIVDAWDDPRLVTIRALRNRGIFPEAIHNLALNVRMTLSSTTVDWNMLAAENRRLLDSNAKRYFFVPEPVKLEVKGAPKETAVLKYHPNIPKLGERKVKIAGKFFIAKEDTKNLKPGDIFRLKDLYTVKVDSINANEIMARFVEEKAEGNIPKFQWVTDKNIPALIAVPGELVDKDEKPLPYSLNIVKGLCEEACKKIKRGEVVQFERFGFVKIEKAIAKSVNGILAHK